MSQGNGNQDINIRYTFRFEDDRDDIICTVSLGAQTLYTITPEESRESEWTRLSFEKCRICPLDERRFRNCPIAFNLSGIVGKFTNIWSTEPVHIIVDTQERSYMKKDAAQQGIRSLFGIIMATSGCPHMDILKPMARFHLPFASLEETIFRHVTTYLLGQYFEHLHGNSFDVSFAKVSKKYEMITLVNEGIGRRIKKITEKDANFNALLILNVFGPMIQSMLKENLKALQYLFLPADRAENE